MNETPGTLGCSIGFPGHLSTRTRLPHRASSSRDWRRLLRQCNRETASCAAHSLAEFYATLTRLPPPNRASPRQALLLLENITEHLAIVTLSPEDYRTSLREAALAGVAGGTLYDFLIARCALIAKVDVLFTWSTRHYQLFGPAVTGLLQVPQ